MKLFEHPDFEQAILRATEHFQNRRLRAAIIEKHYYVTEALRLIAITAPDKIIFKGATSLAKGWNPIQRFSEDIDIFLDPLAFKHRLGKNAIDRELKRLRDTVGAHAALTFVADESKTIGGFGRNDRFSYIHASAAPGPLFRRNPFHIPRSYVFTNICFCLTKNSKKPCRFSNNWRSAPGYAVISCGRFKLKLKTCVPRRTLK
jgi:hypothetical protein